MAASLERPYGRGRQLRRQLQMLQLFIRATDGNKLPYARVDLWPEARSDKMNFRTVSSVHDEALSHSRDRVTMTV